MLKRFATLSFLAMATLALISGCTAGKRSVEEVVASNQFFMLVLEIKQQAPGVLTFTPIYEGWKEGRLKPFGPGPENGVSGYWRADHLDVAGKVLGSEWIKDPMQGIYEYSEDGQEIKSVEFALQESAQAFRIPARIYGMKNDVASLVLYRVLPGDRGDEKLYEYHLPKM